MKQILAALNQIATDLADRGLVKDSLRIDAVFQRVAQYGKHWDQPLDQRVIPFADMEPQINEQDQLRNDHPRYNPNMHDTMGPDEGEPEGTGSLEERLHGEDMGHKGVAHYFDDITSPGMQGGNLDDFTWENGYNNNKQDMKDYNNVAPRHAQVAALVRTANKLDQAGFTAEADEITRVAASLVK